MKKLLKSLTGTLVLGLCLASPGFAQEPVKIGVDLNVLGFFQLMQRLCSQHVFNLLIVFKEMIRKPLNVLRFS